MLIGRKEICSLIPHAGNMCLLDEVHVWDEKRVVCLTHTHLDLNNPLRSLEGLSSLQAVEYGAQSAAVHGGLLARERNKSINSGYLAALKEVNLYVDWLHVYTMPLTIEAHHLFGEETAVIYGFRISADKKILVEGRATIMAQTLGDVL